MNIVPFSFESREVRVVQDDDGQVCVVAKDLAEALGYAWNGTSRIQHVPEEWRGVTSVVTPSGTQEVAILTEQGMYFFLARSDKPKALPFQKWLAGEVLPSRRSRAARGPPPRASPRPSPPAPHGRVFETGPVGSIPRRPGALHGGLAGPEDG